MNTAKYLRIFILLIFTALICYGCASDKPASEPLVIPEELKTIRVVYGWDATDVLENAGCEGIRMETINLSAKKTDPFIIQRRAAELKADVAQVIFDDDVRFWLCGKAKDKEDVADLPRIRVGELIGTVGGFEGNDIIVNGKDAIGIKAPIGRALIVDVKGGEYVYLQSTFPMQTVVKCKLISGDRKLIKKGQKVYLKP
ncbi:MAG: hypothetical protein LBT84_04350 [Spirochaetia bacterium]|jgi:hypothetical protein|nr:hypothetical protein [Spirochaetia bacterium]